MNPTCRRIYDLGNTVFIANSHIPFTNALIVGYNWGLQERKYRRQVWVYWVRDVSKEMGSEMFQVAEDEITDRISV